MWSLQRQKFCQMLQYKCCKEVNPEHPDFDPISNQGVLTTLAPLLKGKNGRGFHRQPGNSENE